MPLFILSHASVLVDEVLSAKIIFLLKRPVLIKETISSTDSAVLGVWIEFFSKP